MRRLAFLLAFGLCAVPAHAQDPVLVAVGDVACAPSDGDYQAGAGTFPPAATPGRCHQNYTADLIEGIAPDHLLALGDLQYEDGALSKFNVSYDASFGRPAIKVKTKPVPGNHEYGAGNTTGGNIHHDDNATGYFTYFQAQLAAEGADAGNPRKGWYSFDVPVAGTKWHVIALNSECAAGLKFDVEWDGGCDHASEQEQWLRADLAADKSDCTIAYWHHPRYSSGNLGDNAIMAPIWEALYEDYADIVLAGHDHNYERFAPKSRTGAVAPGRGIRSWVVGTGGKDLLALRPPRTGSEMLSNAAHGVLKLTLHGQSSAHPYGWYEWQFLNDAMSGSTFTDSGSGDCVGPPRPAAVAPAKPAPKLVPDGLAPQLSNLRLSRKRFRVGRRGTVFGFTLSEASTATLRIDRKRRGRYRRAGSFKRKLPKGRARVRFSGRLRGRRLKPGVYRLTITLKDSAGNVGKPRRLFFRILE